ncbi:uncharacterized protein KZ484_001954 [Pholidichthys leucotaenia]
MLNRFKAHFLLQALSLLALGPTCGGASSYGLTVHVVPLNSDGGKMVRAHFTAIVSSPCPPLSGLCAAGEDCFLHTTSLPFVGSKPSDWCVRQWQKTVPSDYKATINLGSDTEFYVSMNAGPKIRANSGRLNQPVYVALPPPLRARVNCPRSFYLAVKDLDGDRVQCRFARPEDGECLDCPRHSFIELDELKCKLTFTGKAPAGQYFIYLMAEDWIPAPRMKLVMDSSPLSSVPVHLSLTVEESTSSCIAEPVATGTTPNHAGALHVLPYQEERISVNYLSEVESVSEIAVVGPPQLYRTGLTSVGPLAARSLAWVQPESTLTRLLPICFVANTKSLQSEPQCMWLYQRELKTRPAGTELKCDETEMTLTLPLASLTDIDPADLQLNSPTCPIVYNSTHLTARISFTGCGTKIVHSGSELVYTNTLKSVYHYTVVIRKPSLILPLACRIPAAQVGGPHYNIGIPTESEAFGNFTVWMEIHIPGEGPLAQYTRNPRFRTNVVEGRVRRETEVGPESCSTNGTFSHGAVGSRIRQLDLVLLSNNSVDQAEMVVSNCFESETEDFAETNPIVDNGCAVSSNTLEIITSLNNSRVYRLDLCAMPTSGTKIYIQCTVNLCISTRPSTKCPELCGHSRSSSILVGNLFSRSFTLTSKASLIVTTPAPATTTTAPTTTPTTTTPTTTTTTTATTTSPTTTTTTTPTTTTPTTTTITTATTTTATTTTPTTTTITTATTTSPTTTTTTTPTTTTPTTTTITTATTTTATTTTATTTTITTATTTTITTPTTTTITTPTTTTATTTAASEPTSADMTSTTVAGSTTTMHAAKQSPFMAGVALTSVTILLQKIILS